MREIALIVPAAREYAPVVSMTLCGMGMLAGLDVDMLGDLRTVTSECIDCLTHQAGVPEQLEVHAHVTQQQLHIAFTAAHRVRAQLADTLDLDITRGVLETLMPEVTLLTDADGVYGIKCAMNV